MAGRGFGKTRTISEWVMSQVRAGRRRIAIVAPTAAAAREVLVEGESGIMNIAASYERPIYEPSKRRLTFPNGAIATTYSAEEPERLRGPQHDAACCDELCLVAGTVVFTINGKKAIELIRPGDYVLGRSGFNRVARSMCTNILADVYELTTSAKHKLIGTNNHPIWIVDEGFVPLTSVQYGDMLMTCNIKPNTVSFGTAGGGGSITDIIATDAENSCTAPYICMNMGLFQTGLTFITKMASRSIITPPILWQSLVRIISNCIGHEEGERLSSGPTENPTMLSVLNARQNFLPLEHVQHTAPGNARIHIGGMIRARAEKAFALPANQNLGNTKPTPYSALSNAVWSSEEDPPDHASSAGQKFYGRSTNIRYAVPENAVICTEAVIGVRRLAIPQAVYNLELEGQHDYFANGILVHNCTWRHPETLDMLLLGLRLGPDPRCVIGTTPKAIKVIRSLLNDETVTVTRGSTYENRDNLPPAFFRQIINRYEGTRLGRQELNAEILEDTEGALWQREWIDGARSYDVPELVRVVVGIDPAVTSGEDSDETGIIVAGRGVDGRGYVLDDLSLRATPDTWARVAIEAYHRYRANSIVAEINNGGEMVELTIRASGGAGIPVTTVHASRSKQTRAEPISALYQQGRVIHVGTFGALEDQMCSWTVGDKSPDRVDACLIAGTKITTAHGDIEIEKIIPGDSVLTRAGWKIVRKSGITKRRAAVITALMSDGSSLTGTGNHPIWINEIGDFLRLDALVCGDTVMVCRNTPNSRVQFTGAIQILHSSIYSIIIGLRGVVERMRFIEKYGKAITEIFRRAVKFIIATATHSIMIFPIWKLSHLPNIPRYMPRNFQIGAENGSKQSGPLHQNGMVLKRALHGIVSMARKHGLEGNPAWSYAPIVAREPSDILAGPGRNIVPGNAPTGWQRKTKSILSMLRAQYAARYSNKINISSVPKLARVNVVRTFANGAAPVYNLEVDGTPEYFANRILVHNCVWAMSELGLTYEASLPGTVAAANPHADSRFVAKPDALTGSRWNRGGTISRWRR